MSTRGNRRPRVSRSCANCRAIKRRCDQQFPQCGQCTRQGDKCPGYRSEWDLVFRDQTSRTIKRSNRQNVEKKEHEMTLTETSPSSPTPQDLSLAANETNDNYLLELQYFGPSRASVHSKASASFLTFPSSPMMRNQVFSSFFSEYFPRKMDSASDLNKLQFILSSIYALPQKGPMLEQSLSALSCIFLGKIHNNEQVLQHGLRLYNRAIRYMSNSISRNNYTNDMVYTGVIFQQIQTHHCPHNLSEWLAHVDGLGAIMSNYRLRMHTNPILAAIFGRYQKLKVLFSGLMHLPKETIAWLNEPNEGGPLFGMMKLLTDISQVSADIGNTDVSDHEAYESLFNECLTIERDHMELYSEIGQNIDGEPRTYAHGELKTGAPPTDHLFGPAYHFSSLEDAMLHLFFWLSLSALYPLIRQCRIHSTSGISKRSQKDDADDAAKTHRLMIGYANKAARCLPYCGQEGMNTFGLYYGLVCTGHLSRIYAHANVKDWPRFLWAQDVFSFMEISGLEYAARFREIWWNYWFTSYGQDSCEVLNFRRLAPKSKQTPYEVEKRLAWNWEDIHKTITLKP